MITVGIDNIKRVEMNKQFSGERKSLGERVTVSQRLLLSRDCVTESRASGEGKCRVETHYQKDRKVFGRRRKFNLERNLENGNYVAEYM